MPEDKDSRDEEKDPLDEIDLPISPSDSEDELDDEVSEALPSPFEILSELDSEKPPESDSIDDILGNEVSENEVDKVFAASFEDSADRDQSLKDDVNELLNGLDEYETEATVGDEATANSSAPIDNDFVIPADPVPEGDSGTVESEKIDSAIDEVFTDSDEDLEIEPMDSGLSEPEETPTASDLAEPETEQESISETEPKAVEEEREAAALSQDVADVFGGESSADNGSSVESIDSEPLAEVVSEEAPEVDPEKIDEPNEIDLATSLAEEKEGLEPTRTEDDTSEKELIANVDEEPESSNDGLLSDENGDPEAAEAIELNEPKPEIVEPNVSEAVSETSEAQIASEPETLIETPKTIADDEESGDDDEVTAMPSAEDLLKQAGSILNGGLVVEEPESSSAEEMPVEPEDFDEEDEVMAMPSPMQLMEDAKSEGGVEETEESQEEDEDIIAMPDPQSLMSEASGEEEDEDIVAMPDPQSLMSEAAGEEELDEDEESLAAMPSPEELMKQAAMGEEEAAPAQEKPKGGNVADRGGNLPTPPPAPVVEDDEEEEHQGGNVADRAGDLPPPPPAPIEIEDEAPTDIEEEEELLVNESDGADDSAKSDDDEAFDPFGGGDSLDGFNLNLDDSDEVDEEDATEEEGPKAEGEKKTVALETEEVTEVVPTPKWKKVLNITSIAAAIALLSLGWISQTFKDEISDLVVGYDQDGSNLFRAIGKISDHAFNEFGKDNLYRMRAVESEIRQVADNEVRIHMLVGAQLKHDLYQAVPDGYAYKGLPFDSAKLDEAYGYAYRHMSSLAEDYPDRPWDRLYKLSVSKNEILSLRFVYRLIRESADSEWELDGIKIRGEHGKLVWPEGEEKAFFGENALDTASLEYKDALANYEKSGSEFLANVDTLRNSTLAEAAKAAIKAQEEKNQVIMALSKGSFFDGIAITGLDAAESRMVTLVITETRDKGGLIKGVFKLNDETDISKHFTGYLDFDETKNKRVSGLLKLTTVAFDGERSKHELPPFFNPGTVSRLLLKTDGFKLEGDSSDVSIRMTRKL